MADFGKTDNNVKEDCVARVLYMFDRLQRGDGIRKKEMVNRFRVSSKSVQRDKDIIMKYMFFNSLDSFTVKIAANPIFNNFYTIIVANCHII